MSSRSIGVTEVLLSRWMMSCVIRSPSCSQIRISRPSPPASGHDFISWSSKLGRMQDVRASLVEEVEELAVLWNEAKSGHELPDASQGDPTQAGGKLAEAPGESSSSLGLMGVEAVADAEMRVHVAPPRRGCFQLPPQLADEHVHGAVAVGHR